MTDREERAKTHRNAEQAPRMEQLAPADNSALGTHREDPLRVRFSLDDTRQGFP